MAKQLKFEMETRQKISFWNRLNPVERSALSGGINSMLLTPVPDAWCPTPGLFCAVDG